ncbi:MAG: sugar transporter substrate-binding protein, partial [Microbacteriaceae bacterium]|nr:sugar transporter substrate-binding protein [Microbacteriaceae bacterium]
MRTTKIALLVGVVAAAMLLSACSSGGGSSSGSGSSTGSINATAKAAAVKAVADASKIPEALTPTTLTKKAPTGKSIIIIGCPVQACTVGTDQAVLAAKALGWTAKVIVADFTPEAFLSSFDSALQLKPDYLMYIAVQPYDVIKDKLLQFKAAGIPVIANSPAPNIVVGGDSPIVGAVAAGKVTEKFSKLQADVVIADAKKDIDHVTFMYDPASPTYVQGVEVFTKEIEAAGGHVDQFKINQGDAGTTLTGQIVS